MRMTRALPRPFLVVVASLFLLFAGGQAREAQAAVPTLSCTPPAAEPEIAALARALNYNISQIYEYVYYKIDYSPTWGSKKGALGTYLDHRGNNIDQNVLFVALLRQSCITANFRYGPIAYAPKALANQFGIDNDAAIFNNTLANGGFSACVEVAPPACTNTGGAPQQVVVDVVWTEATVGSTTYELDPSFKSYGLPYTPIDIGAAMGYAQSTFLSGALSGSSTVSGLPAGVNSIRTVNKSQVTTLLNGYAQKLADYVRAHNPTDATKELIGGRDINDDEFGVGYNASGTLYTDLPAAFETVYTVTVSDHTDGSSPTISKTLYASQIAGKRLTLFYNTSSQPTLALDGAVLGTGAAAAGASQTVSMTVQNPYPAGDNFANYTVRPQVKTGGAFALMLVAGEMGRDQLTRHQQAITRLIHAGNSETSEPVLGESLAAMGAAYLSQSSRVSQIYATYFGFNHVRHEAMGIAGKTIAGQTTAGYVDFPAQISSLTSAKASTTTNTLIGSIIGNSIFNSSLESTAVKQLQNNEAISTVRMFDYSNTDGIGFIEATPANWNSVKPLLTNWAAGDLAEMTAFLQANPSSQVMLPQNGQRAVNSWSGNGYYEIANGNGSLSISYKISGKYNGGFGTLYYDLPSAIAWREMFPSEQISVRRLDSQDPVDYLTGDFKYDHTDIKTGGGNFPFSLALKRSYSSGSNAQKTELGYGWQHNFMMSASVDSDSYEAFGDHNPLAAVPTLVSLYVIKDLSSSATQSLSNTVVSSLIANWLMDRLVNNAVTVSLDNGTKKFIKLPTASGGATFVPPPGDAASVVVNTDNSIVLTDNSKSIYSFDVDGKIASWKDPNGNTVTFTYSGTGAAKVLQSVTNGMGRTLTFTYASGRLTNVGDGTTSVTYAYDASGNLASLNDQRAHLTKYLYDTSSRMTQVLYPSFPSMPFVTNIYDALGKVQKQTDALGNPTYFLAANGERSEQINAEGKSRIFYYDSNGNYILSIDENGDRTRYSYDGIGRQNSITHPRLDSVVQTYDAASNVLTKTTNPVPGAIDVTTGQPAAAIVEKWTYNPTFNKVLTHTDGRGAVTTNAYDTKGNLIKVTQPTVAKPGATSAAPVTTYSYNARGQVLGHRDPEGTLTSNSYDATTFDLLSTTVDADSGHLGLKTSWTYNARGDKLTETSPRGLTTTSAYDAARNLIDVRPAAPFTNSNVTDYSYDADNRQTALMRYVPTTPIEAAHWQTTTTAYNAAGQVSTVTNPDGTKRTTTYDSLGRVAAETSSSGRQVVHKYDAASNPTQLIDTVSGTLDPSITVNLGAVTRETRTYYAGTGGLLETLADGNGNAFTYKYDGFNRLAQVLYPGGTYELHALDANGNETTTRTRSGDLIQFTYDALNRKATKAPAGEESVTYGYDFAGRMLSASAASGAYGYGYDTAGRQVSETSPFFGKIGWTLDADGNRATLTWPDGYGASYAYDTRGRLTDIYQGGSVSSGVRLAHYDYDSLSQRTKTTFSAGSPAKATSAYTWTKGGQVSEIAHSWSAGGSVTIDYAYNQDHQRTSATYSDSSFVAGGLPAASPTYVPNTLNQYGSVGGTTYAYDTRGNLTSDGVWTFGYDTENQLLSASKTGTTVAYTYDPVGRRRSKTVNGVVTRYLSLGDQEIAEYTGSTPVLDRRYLYGLSLDEPMATVVASSGAVSYHLTDGLGSVIGLVTNAAGALSETHSYTAYGQSTVSTGTAFQFAGRRFDPETGLYYNRARMYSPTLGRFLQADPSGTAGGINLYAYVNNDPINLTDPKGLHPADILMSLEWDAWAAGLGGYDLDATSDRIGEGTEYAQLLLFEEPIIVDPPGMTPLEELPEGTANGPRAGKDFTRSMRRVPQGENYPDCVYCGRQTSPDPGPDQLNWDHVIPKSQGGDGDFPNKVPSCRTCNLQKGPRTPEEWYEILRNTA